MTGLRLVPPDADWRVGRRPFLHLLAEAAEALGGRLEMEAAFGHLGRYHPPSGLARPIFGNALGLNAEAAAMLAADKDYTARLLAAEGLPTPRGRLLFSPAYVARMRLKNAEVAAALPGADAAHQISDALGYPVILKPNTGSEGRGVHRPASEAELDADLAALFATDDRVRLEEALAGEDVRVTVLDGSVRLAYRRRPPTLVADGVHTVRAIAGVRLAELAQTHRGAKLTLEDPRVTRCLASQGVHLESVLHPGQTVRLLDSANLSTGGEVDDLTDALSPELAALATQAATRLGLRLAGVDLLVPDVTRGAEGAHILEVNAAPGLDYYASHGPAQWVRARALVMDALSSAG